MARSLMQSMLEQQEELTFEQFVYLINLQTSRKQPIPVPQSILEEPPTIRPVKNPQNNNPKLFSTQDKKRF